MELEVTSIYSDTHDKSVTNQILGNESLDFIVYKSTALFRATNIFQKDLSCIVGYG
jgi:hypothetical protein